MPTGVYKHNPLPETQKEKIRKAMTGRRHKPETIEKIRENAHVLRGEKHSRALLTDNIVIEMREEYQKGASVAELARRYNVSMGCVHNAVRRKTWKHVP